VIYQTLIGTWPIGAISADGWNAYRTRIVDSMQKITREASRFTNWTNPNEAYESALTAFVQGMLDRRRGAPFIQDMERFQERVARAGFTNALAQQVLKLTAPGIPDIYQGTEAFDDSLVDPDNRRPVDFARLERLLGSGLPPTGDDLDLSDARWKLGITRMLLQLRQGDPDLFARGDYLALAVSGPGADRVVAFARMRDGRAIVVVVPRWTLANTPETGFDWGDTRIMLPASLRSDRIRSLFGGESVPVEDLERVGTLLERCPVAVLILDEAARDVESEEADERAA
jgi:(1->4)-alpha-D-glucan 1-alpha-D-glucosylmutase